MHVVAIPTQTCTPDREADFRRQQAQPFHLLAAKCPGDLSVLEIDHSQEFALMADAAAGDGFWTAIGDVVALREAGVGTGFDEQEILACMGHIIDDGRRV